MDASDTRGQWRIIALMALSNLIITADFAIVSVALPSIGRDLGVVPALLSWIVSANALALAGTLILGGKLVDRIGHRRALGSGLALFALASIAAGFAPSFALVLGARMVQGLAVALISPAAFSLITAFLPDGPVRHRALGVFGVTQGASLIVGLLCGGWIVTTFGWRAVFLVNIPFAIVAVLMTLRFLPKAAVHRGEPIDVAGAVIATAAMVLLIAGISSMGHEGLLAPQPVGMLAGAAALLALFVAVERRVAVPLVPATLVRLPMFALSAWLLLLFLAGVGGLFVLSQLYMQRVLGFTAAAAGLGAMPYAIAVIAAGQMAPILLARVPLRVVGLGAGALNLTGLLWLAATMGQPYAASVAPGMMLCALGSVTMFIVLMQTATARLAPQEQGLGSALLFTCQQVGTALGAAVTMMLLDPGGGDLVAADFRLPFAVLAGAIGVAILSLMIGMRVRRPIPA